MKIFRFSFLLFLIFFFSFDVFGAKILVVQSYDESYSWSREMLSGINSVFYDNNDELQVFYLDTRLRTSEEWKVKAGEMAYQKVLEFKPDLVIACDDNAQEYFGMDYYDTPLVFCGVNLNPSKYSYPRENSTGVLEIPFYTETIDLIKVFFPETKKVFFLGDNSETSLGMQNYLEELKDIGAEYSVRNVNTFSDWKNTVENLPSDYDSFVILLDRMLIDENGETVPTTEVTSWTVENCPIPVFTVLDFIVEDGAVAGVVNSAFDQGQAAALMAKRILYQGVSPSSIEISKAANGRTLVNMETLLSKGYTLDPDLEKSNFMFVRELEFNSNKDIQSEIILSEVQNEIQNILNKLDESLKKGAEEIQEFIGQEENLRLILKKMLAENPEVVDVSWIDLEGILKWIEPGEYKDSEGKWIGSQLQFKALIETGNPALSNIFYAVEGFPAIDLEWPVFDSDGSLKGAVSFLIKHVSFLSPIILPKNYGPYEFWVMQTDGEIFFDQDTMEIGRNLFTDPLYSPFESLKKLGKRISEEESGKGFYTFYSKGMEEVVEKEVIWTSAGLHGTQWRLILTKIGGM